MFRTCLCAALVLIGVMVPYNLLACDFCALYTGVLPQDRLNRLEFNHRISRFNLFIPGNNKLSTSEGNFKNQHQDHPSQQVLKDRTVIEDYRFLELRYSFFPTKSIQVSIHIPLQNYQEQDGSTIRERNGFGDITAFGQYGIVMRDRPGSSLRWFAGAGGRIPTGWYYRDPERYAEYFFEQGGRGSAGVMLLSTLNFRVKNLGTTSVVNWNWLSPRSFQYRPGSILNINQFIFWLVNLKNTKVRLVPALNIYLEMTEANKNRGYPVSHTGGISILSGPDVSLYFNRWMLRSGIQFPVYENFNGIQPENSWRWQMGMAWNFGNEK